MSVDRENRTWTCLSGFILKLIAFATMTIDHVGAMLQMNDLSPNLAIAFRVIGRLALPLFCFLIAEGFYHSKKPGNYMLRLGIMATVIALAHVLFAFLPLIEGLSLSQYFGISIRDYGNIFMDLLLGGLGVFLLKQKKWYLQVLAVIPFLIGFGAFICYSLENSGEMIIHWFPFFIRPQYHFYSIGMIMLFYVGHIFKNMYLKIYSSNSGIPVESLRDTQIERKAYNVIAMGILAVWSLVFYLVGCMIPENWVTWDIVIQNAAIVSGAFILLYSGKRGYNAKWFQYGSYLFYPLHLVIIFGIGLLIML